MTDDQKMADAAMADLKKIKAILDASTKKAVNRTDIETMADLQFQEKKNSEQMGVQPSTPRTGEQEG